MMKELFQARLAEYAPQNQLDQENLLQETMQHYILASLSNANLFSHAMFHGGTCLHIFHRLRRFSEDLDFLLKAPSPDFSWPPFLERVKDDCAREGIVFEAVDKSRADNAVKKAFLKTDSIGQVLYFDLPFQRHKRMKLRIKLEIDTNPPAGSHFNTAYLDFPHIAPVTVQTLTSGFATKLHALLCRVYVKGRDWYDFIWYVSRRINPQLDLLANALLQQGPWADAEIEVTPDWLCRQLQLKIAEIDWEQPKNDVQRFLPTSEQANLNNWHQGLFTYYLDQLSRNMAIM